MNLPNKLSVMRMIMVPIFVVVMMLPFDPWCDLIGVALFIIASLTDMLDGKIARKYNLVTDFGKFIDPLADKFMVIGALLVILYKLDVTNFLRTLFIWAVIIVIFRELAVTSIRLVASSSSGVVIAANYLGKIKTCTQIVCVCAVILEPIIYSTLQNIITLPEFIVKYPPLSYVSTALMIIFTLWSGINYIVSYWKYLDPQK